MVREWRLPIHASRAVKRMAVAWPGVIDDVLYNGRIRQAQRGEHETNGNSRDRFELDVRTAECWVYQLVKDRDEDDDADRVKVLHQVVWHTVTLHLRRLADEVAAKLPVAYPEDRVEGKDLAGTQRTLELFDEVVVPWYCFRLAIGCAPGRLGRFGIPVGDHDANRLKRVCDDRALRRTHNVPVPAEDEDGNANAEHEPAHQEGTPEADVVFHERRGEQGQAADVYTGVKHHVDPLIGDGRVNNNTLSTGKCLDCHDFPLVLVRNKWCDIGLDAASAEGNDDDGRDIAAQ